MFMAAGVGAFVISIFHVMTHAFFKALMFLGAGSVIHGMHHEQDMRRMGGLKKYMPYTYWTFFAGWLAICGIIPFSGFWSKDEILWNAASTTAIPFGWLVWLIGTIAATCTAFYMTRLMAMTFWGKERFHDKPETHDIHGDHGHAAHVPHESPRTMWVPLVVLAVLATIGGLIGIGPAFKPFTGADHPGGRLNINTWLRPIVWNPQTHEFNVPENAEHGSAPEHVTPASEPATESGHGETHWFNLAHSVQNVAHISHLATEWLFIFMSLIVAGIGIGLGWLFYRKNPRLPDIWAQRLRPLYAASYNKFWVDEFYGWAITRRVMDAARGVFAFDSRIVDGIVNGLATVSRGFSLVVGAFDKYFVDGIVNTIAAFIKRLMSPLLRAAQTGFTQNYALVMVLGLMVAVAIFFAGDIARALRQMLGAVM
jgi:NADH-quinone oxidoreductase subunit L